jgi:diguanylate cyclase (GGDEF)-like protein/PAS domain S-box-containing protein
MSNSTVGARVPRRRTADAAVPAGASLTDGTAVRSATRRVGSTPAPISPVNGRGGAKGAASSARSSPAPAAGRRDPAAAVWLDRLALIVDRGVGQVFTFCPSTLRLTYANEDTCRCTGYTAAELRHKTVADLLPGLSAADLAALTDPLRTGARDEAVFEAHQRRQDGSSHPVEVRLTWLADPGTPAVAAFLRDISLRVAVTERIRHMAYHDPLTDLPNRRALEEALRDAIGRATAGSGAALLVLDLDAFGIINDLLGHAEGDRVLIHLSALLRRSVPQGSLVAHLGGDEFAVLLEQSPEAAAATAERLRQCVASCRWHVNGHTFDLSAGVGLAASDGGIDAPTLLSRADTALHAAKRSGRNCLVVYEGSLDHLARLGNATQWAARIRDALERDAFVVCFQPIVHLVDGRVEFLETLVRMRDGRGQLISPDAFIGAAETFGLMPQIDRRVVDAAIAGLRRRSGVGLFVNVSPASLQDESFRSFVMRRLTEGAIDPGRLGFEITETAVLQENAETSRWIEGLKRLGCRFSLDDFGAGFASFGTLRRLPVDFVKIDGSFIRGLESDPTQRALVRAVRAMSRALGQRTIAEYVESEAALRLLRRMGVDYAQGYFVGEPVGDLAAAAGRGSVAAPGAHRC